MFNFIRHSLATKISLFTSVLVLLTAFLVTYVFFVTSRDILIEKEFQLLRDQSFLVRDKVSHADQSFRKQLKSLKVIAVQASDSRALLSKKEYGNVINYEVKSWLLGQDYATTVTFFDFKEKKIKRKMESLHAAKFDLSTKTLAELFNSQKERSLPIELASLDQELIKKNDKPIPLVHYVIKLPSETILVSFELQQFFEDFITHGFGDDTKLGAVIFFNSRGEIVSHPNDDKLFTTNDESFYSIYQDFTFLKKISLSEGHSLLSQVAKYRGRTHLVSANKTGFISFMLLISEQKIFDNLSETIYQLGLMLGGLVFLFAFVGWFLSRYFLKELAVITTIAKRFIDGEHNLVVPINSRDEIGTLAITMQGLIRQVQEREKNLKRSERRTREARDQAEGTLESKSALLDDLKIQKRSIENMNKDKDDLLAIVSHDLKNPLSVIDTSMDVILDEDEGVLSDTSKDLIRRSKSSTKMALTLITDLLDLARLEGEIKLDTESFLVNDLVLSVVDSHFHVIKNKKLVVNTHFEKDFDLQADYGRMNQVIANILGNACKFTPEGGVIDITVDQYTDPEGKHFLSIVLSDNGPGIPADKINSIFNKYEQARANDRKIGTGLGLAICQKICELHNGKIWVESKENEGAQFHILIPGLEMQQVQKDELKSKINIVTNQRVIIFIDEDKELRKHVAEYFADLKINCLKAKNSAEAMFLIKKYPVEFVISDMRIADTDGISMIRMIRDYNPNIKSILTTINMDTISDKLVDSLDIVKILPKPFSFDELTSIVKRNLLNSGDISRAHGSDELTAPKDRVLVIDDSEDMHALFKVLLKKEKNIDLYHALNGKEGIARCLSKNVKVVFIDMNMPGLNGAKTLHILKKLTKERGIVCPQAVLLTAHDLEKSVVVDSMGFNDYIQKPINKKKIMSVLDELSKAERKVA